MPSIPESLVSRISFCLWWRRASPASGWETDFSSLVLLLITSPSGRRWISHEDVLLHHYSVDCRIPPPVLLLLDDELVHVHVFMCMRSSTPPSTSGCCSTFLRSRQFSFARLRFLTPASIVNDLLRNCIIFIASECACRRAHWLVANPENNRHIAGEYCIRMSVVESKRVN